MVEYLGSDKLDDIQTHVAAAQLIRYPTLLWEE
jgi:hypothetical protein